MNTAAAQDQREREILLEQAASESRVLAERDHIVSEGVRRAEALADERPSQAECDVAAESALPEAVQLLRAGILQINVENKLRAENARLRHELAEVRETNARLGKLVDIMVEENDSLYAQIRELRGKTPTAFKAVNRWLA